MVAKLLVRPAAVARVIRNLFAIRFCAQWACQAAEAVFKEMSRRTPVMPRHCWTAEISVMRDVSSRHTWNGMRWHGERAGMATAYWMMR